MDDGDEEDSQNYDENEVDEESDYNEDQEDIRKAREHQ